MTSTFDPLHTSRAETRVRAAADLGAMLAGLTAVLTFIGYGFNIPQLLAIHTRLPAMSPITATCICLLAAAVLVSVRGRTRQAATLAGGAALLAALVLMCRAIFDADLISEFVEASVLHVSPEGGGRTAVATACGILLVSGAVTLRRFYPHLSNACSGITLVITGTVLLGDAYGPEQIYAMPFFNGVALHTAVALFLLSNSAIFIERETGWASIIAATDAAGGATRRQLLFTLLPPIAGWFLLKLVDLQHLGLDAGMALLVVVTIVPLALLVLRDGRVLLALDSERLARAALLDTHNREMKLQLAAQARQIERETEDRRKAEATMYAAQRLETVGQLTGGIAHDFNNLLMGISGNIQLMRRKLADDHPAMRNAVNAAAAIERGARLTAQLLTFSRSQKLDIRAVEIRPSMERSRELIGHALGPNIDIEIIDRSGDAWARTDRDQLELAILNLVVNARDAMPQGGRVVIEAERLTHAFANGESAAAIAIRVSDNGVGMSPEVAAHAMEPFFTTKEQGKGTGLGLAQVHGFALQCGGDLQLKTELGVGTTVEVILRETAATPSVVRADPVAGPALVQDNARRRLLVIDDDEDVRNVIVELLSSAGFEVSSSADGTAGLAQLAQWRPDAAVIDFLMPGMNGAEVARRAQVLHPGLPILFVSGYSDTVALDGIADATVLRKPFNEESLQRAVARILH